MPETEYLSVLRALADSTRLRMLRTLGSCPSSAEDLATLLGLAPSTVSFHLKKLEQAGLVSGKREQYYRIFSRDEQALSPRLLDIVDTPPSRCRSGADRIAQWRMDVLGQYMRRGRLVKLPRQHAKRWVVLEAIAESFSGSRSYSEQEVNTILSAINEDHCTLRRALVDEGILLRTKDNWQKTLPGPARPGSLRASYEASMRTLQTPAGSH